LKAISTVADVNGLKDMIWKNF